MISSADNKYNIRGKLYTPIHPQLTKYYTLWLYTMVFVFTSCETTLDEAKNKEITKKEITDSLSQTETARPKTGYGFKDYLFATQTIEELDSLVLRDSSLEKLQVKELSHAYTLEKNGKRLEATEDLKKFVLSKKNCSRPRLWAANTLNQWGYPSKDTLILGLVLEVPQAKDSTDILGIYPDNSARYMNFSGKAVVWEHKSPTMEKLISGIFTEAPHLLKHENWIAGRNTSTYSLQLENKPSGKDKVRFSVLTNKGVFYIEKTFGALEQPTEKFNLLFNLSTKVFIKVVEYMKRSGENAKKTI